MTSSTNNEVKLDSELESFRRQWLSDLKTRNEHEQEHHDAQSAAGSSRRRLSHNVPPISSSDKKPRQVEEDEDWLQGRSFEEPPSSSHEVKDKGKAAGKKLVSALDHYEEAMEKEAQGNMGDSLKLYRKAYRLDDCVDQTYRAKHFPATKPPKPHGHQRASSTTNSAVSNPPQPEAPAQELLSIEDLIASFTHLKIQPVPPEIEGMPQPPCPIADLPDEILIHVMKEVAINDVGDFVRLAQVCKHFAFFVATEQRIYRRVTLGNEVGFPAMHYHWQTGVEWQPLEDEPDEIIDGMLVTMEELAQRRQEEKYVVTKSLTPSVYPTWKTHFRSRPRIRFNGCYISTVNYVRTGQASTNQSTWGSPIHIVTYYRYLRFFRDGTLISLLTTMEPSDVVHHLTRADLYLQRGGAHAHLPSAVMAQALKGRWRLSSAVDRPDAPVIEQEGDVFIETEGVKSNYMYRLDLGLRSAGKGTRNNKLAWKGFYSYNKLTDDWAEFRLKNDKPFFFSRVKSYGAGE
ncbi:Fc.00g022490.m01.CDS01 [Cosmosporella sp. VM-42]